jgi:hypothetical protein
MLPSSSPEKPHALPMTDATSLGGAHQRGLEEEIKALDVAIKTAKRDAKLKTDLEAKVALHRILKDLEAGRSQKRRSLYEAQDEIYRRKDELIFGVEPKLRQRVESKKLFTIGWTVH